MSTCTYCGQDGRLTREHILPSFIYKYQYTIGNGKTAGWREKPQKIIEGEVVIKDVCENCNNVVLGEMDAYVKNMLERSGVFTKCFIKQDMIIDYNYGLLSRWLLKLAFNSSRASGKQLGVFDKFKNIILGEESDFSGFVITAGLFKPLKLTSEQQSKFGEHLGADYAGYVNPFFSRISFPQYDLPGTFIKQIVIGALIFHVVVFKNELSREHRKDLTKEYLNMCKGMTLIRKNKSQVTIIQTPLTFIDSMQSHMLRPEVEPHLERLLKNI